MPVANRPVMLGYPSKSTTKIIPVSTIGASTTGYGSHTTDKEIVGEVSRVIISAPKITDTDTINTVLGSTSFTLSMN